MCVLFIILHYFIYISSILHDISMKKHIFGIYQLMLSFVHLLTENENKHKLDPLFPENGKH